MLLSTKGIYSHISNNRSQTANKQNQLELSVD